MEHQRGLSDYYESSNNKTVEFILVKQISWANNIE
jgi:hypothetical protein